MPRPLPFSNTELNDIELNARTVDVIGDLDLLNKIYFPNSDIVSAINAVPSMMSKTFYVDAVNGDDVNGDGSFTAPFKTLSKVASVSTGVPILIIVLKSDVILDSTSITTFKIHNKVVFISATGIEKLVLNNSNTRAPLVFDSCGDIRFNCEVQALNTTDPTINTRVVIFSSGSNTFRFSNLTVVNAVRLVAVANDGGSTSVYVKTSNITTQEANGNVPFKFAVFSNGNVFGVYVEKATTTIDGVQVTDSMVRARIEGIVWRVFSSGERIPVNVLSNCVLT